MNAHLRCVNHSTGGRLWAGRGPCSVQPHALSSLHSLPSYSPSIAQELVTFLPQLPTQAMVTARAAAHQGSVQSSQPQAEVRKSHLALLPPRQEDVSPCASCTSLAGTLYLDKQTVTRGNWSLHGEGQSSPGDQSCSMPVPSSSNLSWKTCYQPHAGTCNMTAYYMLGTVLGQLPTYACRCCKSHSGFSF